MDVRMGDVNLVCRYDDNSVDLEGSAESLRLLSYAIQKPGSHETFSLEIPKMPPLPYQGYCHSLTFERVRGPVHISRTAERILIAGSPESLGILAGNIEFLADQPGAAGSIPTHLHIDYYEGHPYLDKTSTPLVVTRRD